jgi:hypothetical protein
LLRIDDMMEAKLVLTDALISESLRRSKRGERETRNPGNGSHTPYQKRHSHQTKHGNAVPEQDQPASQFKGD